MNTIQEKLASWILRRHPMLRLFVQSFVTAIAFYGGAFLSQHISETYQMQQSFWYIYLPFFLVLLTVVVLVFNLFAKSVDLTRRKWEQQTNTISHAYMHIDRLLANHSEQIEHSSGDTVLLGQQLSCSLEKIQSIIKAAYNVFESVYGRSALPQERIDFEVTFMTISQKDKKLTIPAAANGVNKQPRSMILREKNTEIYDQTVTADIYRMERPRMQIVSDTNESNYVELYSGQKDRIRSSIIFPVLSNSNRLLGTVVVHCDKTGFFDERDRKFWKTLLEIFAKRVAIEMIMIETFFSLSVDSSVAIQPVVNPLY